jgi:VIT1/CCC1 family predicted Fe2+/Mn2+ transporter
MDLKHSLQVGFNFGLTSGVITTLGLMVGLHAGTNSKMIVIGGIVTIAISDAFSDALGIHISEESENLHDQREIWESTITTFLTKFFCAIIFCIPVLLFELFYAILVSVVFGLLILAFVSYRIAEKSERLKVVFEHLLIAVTVIIITHYVGDWIALIFK